MLIWSAGRLWNTDAMQEPAVKIDPPGDGPMDPVKLKGEIVEIRCSWELARRLITTSLRPPPAAPRYSGYCFVVDTDAGMTAWPIDSFLLAEIT